MSLRDYSALYSIVVAVLALVVASPALSRLLVYPRTEFFTELWILDENHKAENYPFNISRDQDYRVHLGIGNQLGYCAYYVVKVKFRNETMPGPDSFNRTPSSLPSLFNITAFVADEEVWEFPLTFSFNYTFDAAYVHVENLVLNGVAVNMTEYMMAWDLENRGCFGFLFFELWIHDGASFQYHERFVRLRLNFLA